MKRLLLALVLSGCCSHQPLAVETLESFKLYRETVIPDDALSADAQEQSSALGDDIEAALEVLSE